ncbi:putative DSBA oxidoreductase [Candidatus Nitrososphaera gargensis Ga9.2]|uniref:Putative DSBA oxidoreductase n=1 Tax=Nitrososphaera gargensis (strain Ga9.2) TaxID=1237085 RepID=K0IGH9_NITGG|nr:DsbA family protein [Candidatus Nitrososphaera gargensis]AFU58910.1 putative DSBA oxidoreductase [Candidatus Nitrososphaera gargensis Ga9.2]
MSYRRSQNTATKKVIIAAAGGVAALAMLTVVFMYSNSSESKQTTGYSEVQGLSIATSTDKSALSTSNIKGEGSPLLGNPSAPITLVEFGDFQCPNCGRFARVTEPQIKEAYIDTGKINMVFRHFPVIGPDSVTAAMASQCANEQGKFWEFHDALYNNQGAENSGWANANNMKAFASKIGLDREKFDSCLDGGKYKGFVESDFNFARDYGLRGTPSFLIINGDGSNPEVLTGAYPFATFKATIDKRVG